MAISTRPEDKFAFLFTGSADPQYVEDIRKVLETLIIFYGYLPENIDVVAGADIPDFNVPDPPDPDNIFHTDGLVKQVLSGTTEQEIKDDFTLKLGDFVTAASSIVTPGYRNCSFIYFTGVGSYLTNIITNYFLEIASISGTPPTPVKLKQSELTPVLNNSVFIDNNHINILMQQSRAYGFYTGPGGMSNLAGADIQLSFTASCDTGEDIAANPAGSEFTDYWKDALQLVPRSGTQYADMEDTGGATPEPVDNFLVSLNKAFVYADNSAGLNPKYEFMGSSEQYLGLPSFLIRDGDQQDPPDHWWESPDIYLTHGDPDVHDDLYVPDTDNWVNIRVFNNGTHPVRDFYIGSIIFLSGGGGTGDSVVHIVSTILKPGESYLHTYPYDFSANEAHRCIRAKAQVQVITKEQIDQDGGVEDVAWFVADHDNEAQRNLDPVVAKKSSAAPAEPDTATVDEDDPGEAADPVPENGTGGDTEELPEDEKGSKSLRNIRGLKEHIYVVRNIFDKPHKFKVILPDPADRLNRMLRIEWFEMPGKKKAKPLPVKVIQKPEPHFIFSLEPGMHKELLMYLAVKPKVAFNGEIKIPVEIQVDTKPAKAGILKFLAKRGIEYAIPDFLSFAGITIYVRNARRSDIYGKVTNRLRRPVPGALVYISTANGRQSAVVRTDKNGNFNLPWIDSDIYILWVKTKAGKSETVKVYLKNGCKIRLDLKDTPYKSVVKKKR